ncbi:MAG: zinc ribbon domain-containing protein [Anaerolineales bacterium]
MDTGSILLLLAVLLLAALFVARPFLENRRAAAVSAEEQQLSSLMAERDRLITTLQELDFDQTLGKIPADDYPTMRAELMQQAANVLRKLDTFQASQSAPVDADAESRIEAVIAARRADAAARSPSSRLESDDALEGLIASRKAARKEKSAGFCPKCGKAVLRSDRFCPNCGQPINKDLS